MYKLSGLSNEQFRFLAAYFGVGTKVLELTWNDTPSEVQCSDMTFARMLQRFKEWKTVVFPLQRGKTVRWYLLNREKRKLLQDAREIRMFLGHYGLVDLQIVEGSFEPSKGDVGKWGAQLFPEGYAFFSWTMDGMQYVWNRLGMWVNLDEMRPEIPLQELETNEFTLRRQFQQYLSLQRWGEGEQVLELMDQEHLVSDDNYRFLLVHLRSARCMWDKIWEDEFDRIAGLDPIPLLVRKAMLTAFYYVILADHENRRDVRGAFEAYKIERYKLGTLLGHSVGVEDEYLVRIFAYESAFQGKVEKLKEFLQRDDTMTILVIRELIDIVLKTSQGAEMGLETPVSDHSDLEQAVLHYKQKNFDEAYLLLLRADRSVEKVRLLCGIAFHTEVEEMCIRAQEEYYALEMNSQQQIHEDSESRKWADFVLQHEFQGTHVWLTWFKHLLDPDYPLADLEKDFRKVGMRARVFRCTLSVSPRLSDMLETITSLPLEMQKYDLLVEAMPLFVSHLVYDSTFPQYHARGVYKNAFDLLQKVGLKNSINLGLLVCLAGGLLEKDPERAASMWGSIESWIPTVPTVRFSSYVLEGLACFADYGWIEDSLRIRWAEWAAFVIQFSEEVNTEIKKWWQVGRMIKGDPNLLRQLECML